MTNGTSHPQIRPGVGLGRFRILHFEFLILLLLLPLAASAASAVSTNLPPVSLALPDAGISLFRVLGALAFVLAIFLGGVWLFRNWQRLARQGGHAPQLQLLETRALGHRHVLYVVGYQQQRLLLAASPAGVALVSHLPPGDADETPPPVTSAGFVQALQQAVQRKA